SLAWRADGGGRGPWRYARGRGCTVRWNSEVRFALGQYRRAEIDRLATAKCQVYVSVDADVAQAADVPGVSAPNVLGLAGWEVISCARLIGRSPRVSSFDLVEINPVYDRDDQSARWAALVVWNFLIGLAGRNGGDGSTGQQ